MFFFTPTVRGNHLCRKARVYEQFTSIYKFTLYTRSAHVERSGYWQQLIKFHLKAGRSKRRKEEEEEEEEEEEK